MKMCFHYNKIRTTNDLITLPDFGNDSTAIIKVAVIYKISIIIISNLVEKRFLRTSSYNARDIKSIDINEYFKDWSITT